MRSMADFGPAFTDPRNLVVGPLALVGGAEIVPEAVVLAHDGQKFPVLVKAGHTVAVTLPRTRWKSAGLGYGQIPQGRVDVDDGYDTIRFTACGRGEASGSRAGGPVTFWSGVVLTVAPTCLPLVVYVDRDPTPRSASVSLGAPC